MPWTALRPAAAPAGRARQASHTAHTCTATPPPFTLRNTSGYEEPPALFRSLSRGAAVSRPLTPKLSQGAVTEFPWPAYLRPARALPLLGCNPALLFAPLRLTHPLTRFIPLCALPSRPAPRPVSFCSPLLTPTSLTRRRRRSARAPLYWPPCVDPRPQVFLTLTTHRPPPRARRRARGRPERTASP